MQFIDKSDAENLRLCLRLLDVLHKFTYPQDDQIAERWVELQIKEYVGRLARKGN